VHAGEAQARDQGDLRGDQESKGTPASPAMACESSRPAPLPATTAPRHIAAVKTMSSSERRASVRGVGLVVRGYPDVGKT
jgi:hypothetical protein